MHSAEQCACCNVCTAIVSVCVAFVCTAFVYVCFVFVCTASVNDCLQVCESGGCVVFVFVYSNCGVLGVVLGVVHGSCV